MSGWYNPNNVQEPLKERAAPMNITGISSSKGLRVVSIISLAVALAALL
jgi:hypothetical protein